MCECTLRWIHSTLLLYLPATVLILAAALSLYNWKKGSKLTSFMYLEMNCETRISLEWV